MYSEGTHRMTVKKLAPAILYRLLARNLALDRVGDDILKKIQDHGIDSYYDHLSKEGKIFYHGRVGKRYMNYRHDRKALEQYRQLAKLQGWNFTMSFNLLILKLRLLFGGNG